MSIWLLHIKFIAMYYHLHINSYCMVSWYGAHCNNTLIQELLILPFIYTKFHLDTIYRSKDMTSGSSERTAGDVVWHPDMDVRGLRTARLVYKALYCTRRSDVRMAKIWR